MHRFHTMVGRGYQELQSDAWPPQLVNCMPFSCPGKSGKKRPSKNLFLLFSPVPVPSPCSLPWLLPFSMGTCLTYICNFLILFFSSVLANPAPTSYKLDLKEQLYRATSWITRQLDKSLRSWLVEGFRMRKMGYNANRKQARCEHSAWASEWECVI